MVCTAEVLPTPLAAPWGDAGGRFCALLADSARFDVDSEEFDAAETCAA